MTPSAPCGRRLRSSGAFRINAKNAGKGAPQLSARIGLELGPVVVEATGEVFGEAPNVAARVQAAGRAGNRCS